jgi:1-phosphofructokinase
MVNGFFGYTIFGDNMVYTVTLNPAIDYFLTLSEIKDDIQIADNVNYNFGGKGINVSVILSNLNVNNVALGFVGGFSGDKLCSLLSSQKVNTDFIHIDDDTRINVKISGAKNIVINSKGPSITLKNEQDLIKKISNAQKDDYIVLSGSIPSSMGDSAYERILECVDRDNINIVVDTTGKGLRNVLKYRPFLIKPNNFELEELFGRKFSQKSEIVLAVNELQALGARNVLVSMGKQGMILVDENGDVNTEPIIDGEVKNTTGCGDSSVAGFIAGYIKTNDYRYALRLASVCANATAFSDKLATRTQIQNLIDMM